MVSEGWIRSGVRRSNLRALSGFGPRGLPVSKCVALHGARPIGRNVCVCTSGVEVRLGLRGCVCRLAKPVSR